MDWRRPLSAALILFGTMFAAALVLYDRGLDDLAVRAGLAAIGVAIFIRALRP